MKTFDITIPVVEAGFDELTPQQQQLVTLARKATYRSYAPYSKFSVGAAILLSNGEIVTGSNQEKRRISVWTVCRTHGGFLCPCHLS